MLDALGVDLLTTEIDDDPSWFERLYDKALAIYPSGDEPCERPFCRRVMFMYGEVYDHDNLNEATHDHLHEAFGAANITALKQITQILRDDHAKSDDGAYDYLDGTEGLAIPIAFIHGEHNRLFLPEGSDLTYTFLREHNDPALYSLHVIPGLLPHGLLHRQGCRARCLSARDRTARPAQLTDARTSEDASGLECLADDRCDLVGIGGKHMDVVALGGDSADEARAEAADAEPGFRAHSRRAPRSAATSASAVE